MPWRGRVSSRPDQRGFTTFEALVALGLLSLLGGAPIAFSSGGMRAIERARAASASASTLLAMDDRLRNMAGRVRIPYWERRATVALEPGGASVSYYEGEESSRLGIVLRGKSLTLSASGDEHSFSPIDEPRVALLKTAAGELSGISLEFSLRGKRYLIAAPFGATPFGVTPFGEASR